MTNDAPATMYFRPADHANDARDLPSFRPIAEHDGKCPTATEPIAMCECQAAQQSRYTPGKVYVSHDRRAAYIADANGNLRRCAQDQHGNLLIRIHKPTKAERKAERRARRRAA